MENFDDFENKSYEKAREINYKFRDHVKFTWNFIGIFFSVFFLLISETFMNFLSLFRFQKPKDISGQVALVTGLFLRFVCFHNLL